MRKVISVFLLAVLMLSVLGMVVLVTASGTRGEALYRDPNFFWVRQIGYFIGGFTVALFLSRFDYHWFRDKKLILFLFFAVVAMLLSLWIPGVGKTVNGSLRWFRIPGLGIQVQPSEFAKIMIVIAMSVWLTHLGPKVRRFRWGAAATGVIILCYLIPIALQPDFGCSFVLLVLAGAIMIVARVPLPYFAVMAAIGVMGIGGMVAMNENRMARIKAYMEGTETTSSKGHHLKQSVLSFQAGGPWGVGLGNSIQKHAYLPEAHTDFIFAIAGEELGLPATLGTVVLFAVILFCGMVIVFNAPDALGRYIAFGAVLLLVFQGAFNMGVVTGVLPTKGLALPFVSYGGSSILTDFMAVGLILNVARHILRGDEHLHTSYVKDAVQSV